MPDTPGTTVDVTDQNSRTQEEPGVPPSRVSGESDSRVYTEADIEAARKQEKEKLYKRMETMQEQVQRLQDEAAKRARIEEDAAKARQLLADRKSAEDKARAESEMSAKELLAAKEKEWNEQLSAVQRQVEEERALREQESRFAELVSFRQQIQQQYSDRVAPELIDLIQGETPEELQQSAEDMATRTERILAQTQEAMQTVRQQTPTARITAPASGENPSSQRIYTPEEIRGMSLSEYAKHRAALLGNGVDGGKSRGIFG